MAFWKSLFGGATLEEEKEESAPPKTSSAKSARTMKTYRTVSDAEQRVPAISKEAVALIGEALQIVEVSVEVHRDFVRVEGAGSEGPIMQAARKLEDAHHLHPESPLLHYAYAGGLHVAAQYKSAEEVMRACVEAHPDFPLAHFALEGWSQWKSPFHLPAWRRDIRSVRAAVSQAVQTNTLISTRDGILPRATMFLRDAAGDFQNLQALQQARIELALVISAVHSPPLVGLYGRIYDDPSNPFNLEILRVPFFPRGHAERRPFELLCAQEEIDFAAIDSRDRILLNKRISFSKRMREKNQELLGLLQNSEGVELATEELVEAIRRHQRQFSHADVRF